MDAPAADYARSRPPALSMVPTTTSASRLLDTVCRSLPADRRLGGPVPTASVSCVDLCVMTEARPDVTAVNAAFAEAGGVIGTTAKPVVSTDLRARPESIVMALPETRTTAGGLLRVFGWYDNEWGLFQPHAGCCAADWLILRTGKGALPPWTPGYLKKGKVQEAVLMLDRPTFGKAVFLEVRRRADPVHHREKPGARGGSAHRAMCRAAG